MTERGQRSSQGNKRQTRRTIHYSLKTLILHESYRCKIWAETICQTSQHKQIEHGLKCFPDQPKHVILGCSIPVVEGSVLSDSRGRGDFQK